MPRCLVVFQTLVNNNRLSDSVFVIAGKIEEIDVPEKVDVIISEPMGYMLFNERMLETFLHAKKWLKPGGNYLDDNHNILDQDHVLGLYPDKDAASASLYLSTPVSMAFRYSIRAMPCCFSDDFTVFMLTTDNALQKNLVV